VGLEFDAFMSNDTWTLCHRPLQHNIIRNKWVYKVKRKANGSVERFLKLDWLLKDLINDVEWITLRPLVSCSKLQRFKLF
jgi:hypothetical protein